MDPVQHLAQHLRSRTPLQPSEIDLICSHFQVERVRRETAVVTQGRRYTKLVFVVEGILRVFVEGPEGEDIVKNFVEAGDFFADLECIEKDQPAVVSLSTITDCTLLTLGKAQYIFAVATCVAIPGKTLRELADLCKAKRAKLHAGFVVGAGRSSLMRLNKLDKVIIALNRPSKPLRSGEERLSEIIETLAGCKPHVPETSALLANTFGSMLHGPAMKTFRGMDAQFVVQDGCKGCGTCARVCPRGNVRLENGRPAFTHNCELCHACIQWCPQFAIRHPGFDAHPRQYRNPAVQVSDLV